MATNGATNGHDQEIPEDFAEAPFGADMLGSGYLGYEQLVGTLMWACSKNDIRLYGISSTLDTMTLEREFTAYGAPEAWNPPHQLHVTINFGWPAEYTTLSLYGDLGTCSLYHEPDEPCTHLGNGAEQIVELNVRYSLPSSFVRKLHSDEGIEQTARRVREVFAQVVEHDNIVQVEATAGYSGHSLNLLSIEAGHFWNLEEELSNVRLLTAMLDALAAEISAVLKRFAVEFPADSESLF